MSSPVFQRLQNEPLPIRISLFLPLVSNITARSRLVLMDVGTLTDAKDQEKAQSMLAD
jgi:hypothetical protein